MHIRFNPFAITPPGWTTEDVPACTPRIALVHTACGHHSRESWEFIDPLDYLDGYTLLDKPGQCWQGITVRRQLRRNTRDYAAAHTCPTAAEIAAEEAACAEAMAWLDTLTTCPHCGGDGAPTGQTFTDEAAEPVELEYRCGVCWSYYHTIAA